MAGSIKTQGPSGEDITYYDQKSTDPLDTKDDPKVIHIKEGNSTRHVVHIRPKTGRPILIAVHL
jgi:hypothetical protein